MTLKARIYDWARTHLEPFIEEADRYDCLVSSFEKLNTTFRDQVERTTDLERKLAACHRELDEALAGLNRFETALALQREKTNICHAELAASKESLTDTCDLLDISSADLHDRTEDLAKLSRLLLAEREAANQFVSENEHLLEENARLIQVLESVKKANIEQIIIDGNSEWGSMKFCSAILRSGMFDDQWYLKRYPDVAEDDTFSVSPLVHFVSHGGLEGRNPSKYFDSQWYLDQNLDVLDSKINPLVHYLLAGKSEGRSPQEN